MNQNNTPSDGYKMTEVSPLPEEWGVVKLGEIFHIQQGKALSRKKDKGIRPRFFLRTANVFWGHIDLSTLDQMDFSEEEEKKYALKSGDLLVCEGGDVGRTAMWEGQLNGVYYQNHLHRLRAKNNDVETRFVMYWMQTALTLLHIYIGTSNKTTIPNLSKSRLADFKFPLPPLPEQKKIAAVLSAVQEAKEKTEAVIKATKELKKSLMKYLFTYGPVPVEEAEKVKLKDTEIGEIPEEWKVVRLGDIAEKMKAGGTPRTNIKEYWENGNIPLVKVEDVVNCNKFLTKTNQLITKKGLEQSNAWLVPEESIILSMYGTPGEVCINKFPVAVTQNVMGIIKNREITTEFLYYALKYAKKYTLHFITDRTIFSHFSLAKAKRLIFPLPPLETQQKIASILSAVDEKIEAEENKKKALEDLFKTLLHDLMTAKIRVNHLEVET